MTAKRKKAKDRAPTAWEAPEQYADKFHNDTGRAQAIARTVLSLTPQEAAKVRDDAKAPVRRGKTVKR